LNEAGFWELIATLDWSGGGNDDAVVEPLVESLASMPDKAMADFQNLLAAKLYALDGRAWARESGTEVWSGEPDKVSEDGFLYARLAVVASGRSFYETVLADPTRMPKDRQFEPLMYVASRAYERKTGLDDNGDLDMTDVSFETFSNEDGWAPEV
jgi:Protein of unknown function (DUF4240)